MESIGATGDRLHPFDPSIKLRVVSMVEPQAQGRCQCQLRFPLFCQLADSSPKCIIAFRKKIYRTIEELQQDLDVWMYRYNNRRTHQGKRCQGRTPMAMFKENLPMAQEKMINREEVASVA